MKTIAREEAFNLLKKYNKDPFHIQHGLTVEAVMNGMPMNWVMGKMPSIGAL